MSFTAGNDSSYDAMNTQAPDSLRILHRAEFHPTYFLCLVSRTKSNACSCCSCFLNFEFCTRISAQNLAISQCIQNLPCSLCSMPRVKNRSYFYVYENKIESNYPGLRLSLKGLIGALVSQPRHPSPSLVGSPQIRSSAAGSPTMSRSSTWTPAGWKTRAERLAARPCARTTSAFPTAAACAAKA